MEETLPQEEYVSITEAARRVGKSDKQVRRWVHAGKLVARYPQRNRAEIAVKDLEPFLPRQPPGQVSDLEQILVKRRVAQLEERVAQLEQQVRQLQPRAAKPKITELPAHLESLFAFTNTHNVAQNEVRRLIKLGLIHVVEGKWSTPKGRLEEALDQDGRREFWVQLHDHDGFQTCDDCPHEK